MSKPKTSNSGILFVVSAPSGAGKTTVVSELLRRDSNLKKTVSHTTRLPRPDEKNGKDYTFVTRERFKQMIAKNQFVEWANVYGNYYGTSKKTIEGPLQRGKDVVLVIEEQGARSIRKLYPHAVFILILPPSLKELKRRIVSRKGMTPGEIKLRIKEAKKEIQAMHWYPYVMTNDRLDQAVADLHSTVQASRLEHNQKLLKEYK